MKNKALFLDRDGVINYDHGYVFSADKFEFKPDVFDLVKLATEANYKVVVITNQSGIARGMYTQQDFILLSNWMVEQFFEHGGIITDVFHCPHHPSAGTSALTQKCDCRKPGTALFEQAKTKYEIDFAQSIMVGDKLSDMQASTQLAFAKNYLIDSENAETINSLNDKPKTLSLNNIDVTRISKLTEVVL